jgi:HD-GYP domain-containing protein (c-di-GMP phosphodiesterase class II)
MFIALTVVLGVVQIWFNYQKNTELIKESSTVLYDKVMQQAYTDLKSRYDIAATSVEIIAEGDLVNADNLVERIKHVSVLSKILKSNKSVSGFEVGYANGDFFIIRGAYTDYMREQFQAPFSTLYVIDNIEALSDQSKQTTRIYYDKYLNEISRKLITGMKYDPRTRPWYKLALESSEFATTPPYLYYFVKKVGITITLESKTKGTVVAADIALDDISAVLKNNQITLSSELLLLDDKGEVIAYKDPDKLIVTTSNGKNKIAQVADIGSPVLKANYKLIQPHEQSLQFNFSNQQWGGIVKKFDINHDFNLYFAFIAPDSELFAQAIEIRWHSSLIAFLLILVAVPITAYSAYRISEPLRRLTIQTRKIRQFDFSPEPFPMSMIHEIQTLANDMANMKHTISHFLTMIESLAGEKNLDSLLEKITKQTLDISAADATVLYLINEEGDKLKPVSVKLSAVQKSKIELISYPLNDSANFLVNALQKKQVKVHSFTRLSSMSKTLNPFFDALKTDNLQVLTLPLNNRVGEATGMLCVINNVDNSETENVDNQDRISFMQTLSGFAAVSMESKTLLKNQKDLMASFIKLIAGAIDAKSHYTAGHCLRVPELTRMLATEACKQTEGEFKHYELSEEQWEELDIAAWLHDCGKITTPEYVVDKATKLETIYDRIHEVRMRFEVLKRDQHIHYWRALSEGGDKKLLDNQLNEKLAVIDADYAFVAQCNVGTENMSEESVLRLEELSSLKWLRTLDDSIGVSWEEEKRKAKEAKQILPVLEKLLDDKKSHIIERHPKDVLAANNKWKFNMKTPKYQYNKGELYNLSITKGTLNTEERYKVNEHIIQTIMMLDALKFPKHLSCVQEIAGGHHEKMDGTGYPKRLKREDMSVSARMMAIADIFEALTASDRPYKKAKKLSESIKIMSYMKKDQHIDGPLFDLFLSSGIYLTYARAHLSPDQIDFVDIEMYLSESE